jgi:membrane protease YdiL (CAAX protease family)
MRQNKFNSFFRLIRSSLPTDLSQLVLLLGVLCLFLPFIDLMWINPQFKSHVRPAHEFLHLGIVGLLAIRCSACLGYYVCFRPGDQPVRRLIKWVLLPAGIGISLACLRLYAYSSFEESALTKASGVVGRLDWALGVLVKLGPGFHFSLLGFILVAVFTAALALDRSTLPVTLTQTSGHSPEESAAWARVELFLWALLVFLTYRVLRLFGSGNSIALFIEAFVWDVIIIFVASRIMGGSVWKAIRSGLRLPRFNAIALAALFPVATVTLISAGEFLFDWTRWTLSSSAVSPPLIATYITLPPAWTLIPILLLPALGEEIIFRGLLQPTFVRRFGVVRGILLLTFVFASWHFGIEFINANVHTDALVFWTLCARLVGSVGLCFVTGWLMLKT